MITTLTRTDEVGSTPFDSIAWVFDTHVRLPDTGVYHFAILHGNEDSPSVIEFYHNPAPNYNDKPDLVWGSSGFFLSP